MKWALSRPVSREISTFHTNIPTLHKILAPLRMQVFVGFVCRQGSHLSHCNCGGELPEGVWHHWACLRKCKISQCERFLILPSYFARWYWIVVWSCLIYRYSLMFKIMSLVVTCVPSQHVMSRANCISLLLSVFSSVVIHSWHIISYCPWWCHGKGDLPLLVQSKMECNNEGCK